MRLEVTELHQQIATNLDAIGKFSKGWELGVDFKEFKKLAEALANAKTLAEITAIEARLLEMHLDMQTQAVPQTTRLENRLARMRAWAPNIFTTASQKASATLASNKVNTENLSPWLLDYLYASIRTTNIANELAGLEDSADVLYSPEQKKAIAKLNTELMKANISADINTVEQAKKLRDKLTKKVTIDPELTAFFSETLYDPGYEIEDRVEVLRNILDQMLEDYEVKEMTRITGGKSDLVKGLDAENALYRIEAKRDFDGFLKFMQSAFDHDQASYVAEYVPEFGEWWSKTTDALKTRGIEDPRPLEQYELLELPSDIPLVRNEVECK